MPVSVHLLLKYENTFKHYVVTQVSVKLIKKPYNIHVAHNQKNSTFAIFSYHTISMNKILCFSLLGLLFASCQKNISQVEVPQVSSEKKYPISFNTSGFSTSINAMQSASVKTVAASTPVISYPLYYITYTAYNSEGNVASRLRQSTGRPNEVFRLRNQQSSVGGLAKTTLGTFADTLAAGNYTCIVTAGQEESNWDVPVTFSTQNLVVTHPDIFSPLSSAKFYPSGSPGSINDGFVYKGQMTVGPNSTAQTLTLNRIVGKLKIVIEDALATNVDGVYFDFNTVASYYNLSNLSWESGLKTTFNGNLNVASYAGKTGYAKEIVLPPGTYSFTMRFVDASQKLIVSKQLSVTVVANQITTLTGKVFTTQNTTGFSTSINQNWTTGSTVQF